MKTKRILLAIVCLIVILGGLNYLLQQSTMPIGTRKHTCSRCRTIRRQTRYQGFTLF